MNKLLIAGAVLVVLLAGIRLWRSATPEAVVPKLTAFTGNPELGTLVAEVLGEAPEIELLERSEIDRVQAEQALDGDGLRQLFPHLELYVQILTEAPGSVGSCLIFNARNGFRIRAWHWEPDDPEKIAARIAAEVRECAGRLDDDDAILVAVASLRDAAVPESLRPAARQLAALLENELGNCANLQLLERERLELVSQERELAGVVFTLPGAAQLLHLEFTPGSAARQADLNVRLEAGEGAATLWSWNRRDALADPVATARELADALRKFWSLPAAATASVEPASEAARQAAEAYFLLRAGDAKNALMRAHAAAALMPENAEYRVVALKAESVLAREYSGALRAWPGRLRNLAAELRRYRRDYPDSEAAPELMEEAAHVGVLWEFLQHYPQEAQGEPLLLKECREAVRDFLAASREEAMRPSPYREWRLGEACRSLRQWQEYDMLLMKTGVMAWGTASDPELIAEIALRDMKLSLVVLAQAAEFEPALKTETQLEWGLGQWCERVARRDTARWRSILTELAAIGREHPVAAIQEYARGWEASESSPLPAPPVNEAEAEFPGSEVFLDQKAMRDWWPKLDAWRTRAWQGDEAALTSLRKLNGEAVWVQVWRASGAEDRIVAAAGESNGEGVWLLYESGAEDAKQVAVMGLTPDGTVTKLEAVPVGREGNSYLREWVNAPLRFRVFPGYAIWLMESSLYRWDLKSGAVTEMADWPSPELFAPALFRDQLYVWCGASRGPKQLLRCDLDGGNRKVLISQFEPSPDHPWEQWKSIEPEAMYPDEERNRLLVVANEGIWSLAPDTLAVANLFQCEVYDCWMHASERFGDEIQLTDANMKSVLFDCRTGASRCVLSLYEPVVDAGYPADRRMVMRGAGLEGRSWFDGARVWTQAGAIGMAGAEESRWLMLPRRGSGNGGDGRLYFPGASAEWFWLVEAEAVYRVTR